MKKRGPLWSRRWELEGPGIPSQRVLIPGKERVGRRIIRHVFNVRIEKDKKEYGEVQYGGKVCTVMRASPFSEDWEMLPPPTKREIEKALQEGKKVES